MRTRSQATALEKSKCRQIPSRGRLTKRAARPRRALRCLGSAGSAKPAYQEGGRGGVSTARRRAEWGWVSVGPGVGVPSPYGATASGQRGAQQGAGVVRGGWSGARAVGAKKRPPHGWPGLHDGAPGRVARPLPADPLAAAPAGGPQPRRSSAGLVQCR